ncbi:26S proteasome non-ATPase regulatory subunit 10 [Nymphon striatum]|nr:26S proteasome non-ATPase regulatory subunit 10 [Nymphon striatum]
MSSVEICNLCYLGDYQKVSLKIIEDKSLLTATDDSGRQPLHWACVGGCIDVFNYLVQKGASIECRDEMKWTPLMIATAAGRLDITKALIARGANVNVVNCNGQSSLHYAASKNRLEIAKILLESNADPNIPDKLGELPLHRAASIGSIMLTQVLMEYSNKINLNHANSTGNTPLHLACAEDHVEIAKILIAKGADTTIINKVCYS